MPNTNSGTFYPFQSYINALSLSLDGTYKLYPSKYLALIGGDYSGVTNKCNSNFNSDYISQRLAPFDNIGDPNDGDGKYIQQELGELGKIVCGGDINFLNHETKDDATYNETIIYISQSDMQKITSISKFDEDTPIEDTIFVENEPTSGNENPTINNGEITFDGVMLFYNVYRKVGESIDDDVDIYLQDMPMGIYTLNSEQTLSETQEWVTRIYSTFGESSGSFEVSFNNEQLDDIVKALENFGEIDDEMTNIMNDNYTDLNEVKAYYDNFKNSRQINVPYVQGDWWYVNGKKVIEVKQ